MPIADAAWAIKAAVERPDGRGMYGRFSKNRNGQSQSTKVQLGECRDYFDMHRWLINHGLVYEDDNISASEYSTKERPDYVRLLDAISAGKMWLLVVTEVSRITREMSEGMDIVKRAQEAGGLLIHTTEGKQFDLMTTTGVHDFLQAVLEASRESGTKSDRFKRNKREVAKQGRYNGGKRPYGRVGAVKDKFGRITNTGEVGVTPIPHEVAVLNGVADRLLAGVPLLSEAKRLLREGIMNSNGSPWTASTMRKTLQSPMLIGKRIYEGRMYPEGDETVVSPIMDREKWDQLQIFFKARDRARGTTSKGGLSYLLGGRLRCECGGKMYGHVRREHTEHKRTYKCQLNDNSGKKIGCGRRRLAEPVELLVTDAILFRYNSPGFKEALRLAYQDHGDGGELSGLLARAQELEAKLAELEDAYLHGDFDLKQLGRMQASAQDELSAVNLRASKLLATTKITPLFSGDFTEVWKRADLYQRREFIGLVVNRITVKAVDQRARRPQWVHEGTGKSFQFDPEMIEIDFKV